MAGGQANIRTFITPLTGPGRLAPTLLEDLAIYDPAQPGKPNILRENPFDFTRGDTLGDHVPPDACRHDFWLKPKQSVLPELDERPTKDTKWRVAAMCCKCRVHLTIIVDYTIRWQPSPCPSPVHQLHHFIRSEWREKLERSKWDQNNPGRYSDICVLDCSSEACSASVTVRYTPPEIGDDEIEILVNKDKLRERTEAAFRTHQGNTQGMKQPSPFDVLKDLRVYVANSWQTAEKYRTVKLSNKRFVVRFGPNGDACKDVLESLGFRLDEAQECWHVPEPDLQEPLPLRTPGNVILDNCEHELLALIRSRPTEELHDNQDIPQPTPAAREFERVLSCQDYDKHPASRRIGSKLFNEADHRTQPYNSLGVPMSAADSVVISSYREEMMNAGPKRCASLLESLESIAMERSSEEIHEECAMEQSRGRYNTKALVAAYKSIGLDLDNESQYDDDYILGMFNSRLEDMRMHERELRDNLRIIGDFRASLTIRDAAENAMNTYESALRFLGADDYVGDDQITALFGAKVGDNKTLEPQAMKAVSLIAKHRKSTMLQNWIDSGFAHDHQMTQIGVVEAFHALQIENRTVEDDLILTQYTFILTENPGNADYYSKALEAIARDRDSSILRGHLQQSVPQPSQGTDDAPVGLDNIGNTCYLNSLLQFLFTMVELRQIVLNFDQYKMEPTEVNMSRKKVGQREVTKREVYSAQKFVENLALLFKGMIETPQSAIRPDKELARLTLETHSLIEKRRRSTILGDRPSLGNIGDRPVLGPLPMPDAQPNGTADDAIMQSPKELEPAVVHLDELFAGQFDQKPATNAIEQDVASNKDNSSEATLVSRPGSISTPVLEVPTVESQQAILDNKENLSPTKEVPSIHLDDDDMQPLRPASPSKINAQAGALARQAHPSEEVAAPEETKAPIVYAPPPGKPPPVPPRKPVEPAIDILEEYARQQDVTEVAAHCLFQFSCAMRPTGVDDSGEQSDEIHDMFFGQNTSHVMGGKEHPTFVQFFNIITRVAKEPKDVYAALDTEYDLSVRDDNSSAFVSISKLPPVFSINLNRVVWDAQTQRAIKLNHHVQVPETIFLDRYLDSPTSSDLMSRRLQTWRIKAELSALNERRKVLETKQANTDNLPHLYATAKQVLEHLQTLSMDEDHSGPVLDISSDLVSKLDVIAQSLQSELDAITTRIASLEQQIKESFADMRKHPYRLHAAFFHRGGASGGHYWVYIYDHQLELWRCYNDDRVSVVANLNEIFGKPNESTAYGYATPVNPYFLVYVKEELVGKLVESVKRKIVYPPPPVAPPTFSGFGASVPVRSQVSEMPPGGHGHGLPNWAVGHTGGNAGDEGDVEMIEYANASEHAPPRSVNGTSSQEEKCPDKIETFGDWDDRELGSRPKEGW